MSNTVKPTFLRRLNFTPWRDLLRGRITARFDYEALIATSDLPTTAQQSVRRVVRGTHLWRSEKVDVANELIAHFYDGLTAGESVDDLLAAFGDERQAAKLIRRAKRRNRSLYWKVKRAIGWSFACIFLTYLAAGLYFFAGRPSPSVDYIAQINAPILQTPEQDRAWPIYRQAILRLSKPAAVPNSSTAREWPTLLYGDPRGAHWPEMAAWLRAHQAEIRLITEAAAKPSFGFIFGTNGSVSDEQLWPAPAATPDLGDMRNSLHTMLMPYLNEMRDLAIVLALDARLAREEGDAARVERNLVALFSISNQLRLKDVSLVNGLMSIGIGALGLKSIEETLLGSPQLLSDETLTRLAHRIARDASAANLISYKGERYHFYDAVQRIYTDDGYGDGRLTPIGLQYLNLASTIVGNRGPAGDVNVGTAFVAATGPIVVSVSATRRKLVEEYDRYIDGVEAALHRPLREVDRDAVNGRMTELMQSPLDFMKYALIGQISPASDRIAVTAEHYLGRRDGVATAIALELYRRRHGSYPTTLSELVPRFLPAIPADRITGDPMRYHLYPDGKPLLYSVGDDRDDDGGAPTKGLTGNVELYAGARWSRGTAPPNGDWILFPQTRFDAPPEDADDP